MSKIDFSVLDEILKLDLSGYETTTPAYLEDYERRLIEARFSKEFCIESCHRLRHWYDIVRLARHTRLAYIDYKDHCLAHDLDLPPEPDTISMLLLAPIIDPGGTPEAKDRLLRLLIDLCLRCREELDDEADDPNLALLPGEEPLSLLIPNGRRRRRLMEEAGRCHTGREFVLRVLELALRKGWLTWAQCRREELWRAFRFCMPEDLAAFSRGAIIHHMDYNLSEYNDRG